MRAWMRNFYEESELVSVLPRFWCIGVARELGLLGDMWL